VPLAKINSTSKPTDYFLALKTNPQSVKCYADCVNNHLGLKIQIFIPQKSRFSCVVQIMKPMIDGIISSFHSPKLTSVDEISKLLNINPEFLSSKNNTCLGEHPFVTQFPDSVNWNPQDDRLNYVCIEPVIVDDSEFSFSGRIYSVPF